MRALGCGLAVAVLLAACAPPRPVVKAARPGSDAGFADVVSRLALYLDDRYWAPFHVSDNGVILILEGSLRPNGPDAYVLVARWEWWRPLSAGGENIPEAFSAVHEVRIDCARGAWRLGHGRYYARPNLRRPLDDQPAGPWERVEDGPFGAPSLRSRLCPAARQVSTGASWAEALATRPARPSADLSERPAPA